MVGFGFGRGLVFGGGWDLEGVGFLRGLFERMRLMRRYELKTGMVSEIMLVSRHCYHLQE